MRLDIVIPTLNRSQKLTACLNSIACSKKEHNLHVYLYYSHEDELNKAKDTFKDSTWITCCFDEYKKYSVFWNKHLNKMTGDAMAYMNDDILLHDNTFDELFKTYLQYFPKYEGVMGINQSNLPKEKALQSAFGVIGKNYAKHFPNMQVFCPEYYRFYGDYEILKYSESVGKFHFAENVKIDHLHPDFAQKKDETHRKVRDFKAKDILLFSKRQAQKLLWGRDFKIVEEE